MSVVLLVIFTVVLVYFAKIYLHRRKVLKMLENIPCGRTLPIFGHALDYKGPTYIIDDFMEASKANDFLFRLTAFWQESVVVSNHRHAEALLNTTKILHKSKEYENVMNWLGTGLLTAAPYKWKQTRKIITPTFHFQILEQFIDVFNSCSEVLIIKLKEASSKGSNINIYDFISLCTLDVICETAMGTMVNAQSKSDSKYVKSVKEVSRILAEKIFSATKMFPLLFYFTADYKIEKDTLKYLHEYTYSMMQNRRKELAWQSGKAVGGKKRLAFLDMLMQSTIDGRPITDEEIREEVDTFMFEGHDTTSTAISAIIYCLAFNMDVQEKAFAEVNDIFEGDRTRQSTHAGLQNMKYLEMVIKEALRLYPPVPLFGRIAEEDTQLDDLTIPKGVNIAIFSWGLHRDPKIFPDPDKFDPERFTLENQNQRDPFSYVPFSAGPRNCIGQRFAMLEMKSTIAKILMNFVILPVRDFKPLWVPDMVLKSLNGIQISLKDRYI